MHHFVTEKNIRLVRAAVFAAALIFIGIGIMRAEHLVVLKKAVNICLECIGIG